ncbi:hypothetical protein ACFE04_030537 [Oxalis oulophora]
MTGMMKRMVNGLLQLFLTQTTRDHERAKGVFIELMQQLQVKGVQATINNDTVQWLSRELDVARDDAIWCRKESEFLNVVTVEIAKLRKGVQEMINVINGKNGKNAGRVVRKGR